MRFGARDYDPQKGRWMAKEPTVFEWKDCCWRRIQCTSVRGNGWGTQLGWRFGIFWLREAWVLQPENWLSKRCSVRFPPRLSVSRGNLP
jgi:hypothetical protein